MNYYKENGDKIKCDKTKLLGSGCGGCTYKTSNNETIKIWYYDVIESNIEIDLIKEINDLKLNNYYKILSLLYKRKSDVGSFDKTSGYLYEYIDKDDVDILTMPVDYTIDNLNELYKSILILTSNNILADDFGHPSNVIMNKQSIIAIDIDYYTKNHFLSSRELRNDNIFELRRLFISLYIDSLKRFHSDINNITYNMLSDLFSIQYKEGVNAYYKKLSKYKYPIEYFK